MSNYRPLTDVMILARSKVKYYGAYPAGFLGRARHLLGVRPDACVLHVCAGRVRDYPYEGLGPNDITVDLDPETKPDLIWDVRQGVPEGPWDAILMDLPYTPEDAAHYGPGAAAFPSVNDVLKSALSLLPIGGRVGVLDYLWPHPGKLGKEIAVLAVGTGRNGRARWYTVWERLDLAGSDEGEVSTE
jgi:hypothetical protein